MDGLRGRVRVTHPFHPRFGEELEVLDFRGSFGREWLECRDGEGRLVCVRLSWTDACGEDPFRVVSAGRAFVRPEDLLELSELLEELWS